MSAPVHVAVGVIVNDAGEILLGKRHEDSHQGGLWEFPGGKVEPGEDVVAALGRELKEELDIEVVSARALVRVEHDYGDKRVLLDTWLVEGFSGSASGCEGQDLAWVAVAALRDYEFPAANIAIVEACEAALGLGPGVQS